MGIPAKDKLWAIFHEGMLSNRNFRLFACNEAEVVLRRERRRGREPDPRSWEVLRVARRYANGKASDEELAAA
ncbi:MAG: hypothetical protein ABII82_15605, partial [Verrucomicrobiota bacterium]